MNMRVVITAGGTTESIDDVRTLEATDVDGTSEGDLLRLSSYDISNISKGGFAVEIARALHAREPDADITIIGRQELVTELKKKPEAVWLNLVPFRSFADLDRAIQEEVARTPVDAFLMAAAVSDYSPVAVEGKISSQEDELLIRLRRNPKLLNSLRERLGSRAVLVGFKLLSSVSPETLLEVAKNQVVRCCCDFTVANDAAKIDWSEGWHPFSLVSAEKEDLKFEGLRPEGAAIIASKVVASLQFNRDIQVI